MVSELRLQSVRAEAGYGDLTDEWIAGPWGTFREGADANTRHATRGPDDTHHVTLRTSAQNHSSVSL